MRTIRIVAIVFLAATAVISLSADWLAPHSYEEQFREHAGERPTWYVSARDGRTWP